ncbi:hypothetical protein HPB50_006680 [Hyalomma asiaticum]|uniref:Uncharacterized protein n=1 Tax=Hyalomma asiaticum TaxID=266040 RepID=A0ACB7S5X8_HYAAI|nr:hypothetical protein HPB50_006680 [Hyalomma asiaticum]
MTTRQIDSIYERLSYDNEQLMMINVELERHMSEESFEAKYATVIECEGNATSTLADLQCKS